LSLHRELIGPLGETFIQSPASTRDADIHPLIQAAAKAIKQYASAIHPALHVTVDEYLLIWVNTFKEYWMVVYKQNFNKKWR